MTSTKLLISSSILLVFAIVFYIYGFANDIIWMYTWSTELGGAAIVTLFVSISYIIMGD